MELTSIAEFVDELVDPRSVFTAETELMGYLFLQCGHGKRAIFRDSGGNPKTREMAI
jgi:hypothetical protein